jgi:hypothetical protein
MEIKPGSDEWETADEKKDRKFLVVIGGDWKNGVNQTFVCCLRF